MDRQQILDRVTEVMGILREASVPDSAMPAAFDAAWQAYGGAAADGGRRDAREIASPLENLSRRSGISEEVLGDLFGITEEGEVAVKVPVKQLSAAKATATIELALLTCAVRQSGLETATHTRVIRQVCDEYGRLDGANFATGIRAGDRYWQLTGRGADVTLSLRRQGWEDAFSLMRRLAGVN